jgi:serine/threonine protein kinase
MSESPNARPGAAPTPEEGSDALPPGTRLAEFEIREVLGAGGFGVVYRAWDDALQRDVALKEYMPVSLAGRGAGERVTLRARAHEENFALGLQSFVNEARLLARFDQPALVKVFRFWEGNGTAYMAMPLYKGRNLRQLRKERGPGAFNDAWMRALIEPLLGALEAMHDAAVYHRDIAPDNILWCDNQRPVLLDFGAARLVLADRTQNVTAILKPQFAPIEQYAETQSMRQGPWTDLYALAGTCYFLLTGRAPLPATARVMGDELEPLASVAPPGCSPQLLQALDWAMAVRPQDRPQSVAQWRDALAGRIAIPARPAAQAPHGPRNAASDPAAYEKTIQATMRTAPPRRSPGSPAPAAHSRHGHDLETPERSVMLPPQSQSPLKAVLLLLVLVGGVAAAWTTRPLWMPALGLQTVASPAAQGASSAGALASEPAGTPASAPVAEAASAPASQSLALADEAPASAAAAPVVPPSAAASVAPEPEPVRAPVAPVPSKASKQARNKALEARIAALKMPPPDLPPPPPGAAPANAPPAPGRTSTDAAQPAASIAAPASRPPNWREVCADQEPAKIAACVKRLCDDDARYQRYPICQRVRRQEEKQQRGTPE